MQVKCKKKRERVSLWLAIAENKGDAYLFPLYYFFTHTHIHTHTHTLSLSYIHTLINTHTRTIPTWHDLKSISSRDPLFSLLMLYYHCLNHISLTTTPNSSYTYKHISHIVSLAFVSLSPRLTCAPLEITCSGSPMRAICHVLGGHWCTHARARTRNHTQTTQSFFYLLWLPWLNNTYHIIYLNIVYNLLTCVCFPYTSSLLSTQCATLVLFSNSSSFHYRKFTVCLQNKVRLL